MSIKKPPRRKGDRSGGYVCARDTSNDERGIACQDRAKRPLTRNRRGFLRLAAFESFRVAPASIAPARFNETC